MGNAKIAYSAQNYETEDMNSGSRVGVRVTLQGRSSSVISSLRRRLPHHGEEDAMFRNGRQKLICKGSRENNLFGLYFPAKKLLDRDPVPFQPRRGGNLPTVQDGELTSGVVFERSGEWVQAAKGGRDVFILYPEERKKTGGHGQRICDDPNDRSRC